MTTETLVQSITDALPDSHEWDEREAALLDLALRQAPDLDLLEADIAHNGVRLERGQLNSALMEARQSRVALARVLGQVEIPGSEKPSTVHARKAANVRWANGASGVTLGR